nr:truncated helicase isoform [Homo sapiens]
MASVSALTEELDSITSELHAVEIQIQELTERQQELIQKKKVLTKKIKQCLEDSYAYRRWKELMLPVTSIMFRWFYTRHLPIDLSYGRPINGFKTIRNFSNHVKCF